MQEIGLVENSYSQHEITLRDYQAECISAIRDHFAGETKCQGALVTLPTGSGKSIIIAAVACDAALNGDRVLCVTPTRELAQQNADKIQAMFPGADLGIFSAGLDRRDTDSSIVVGTINSAYDRTSTLTASGPIDLVIVDECHRIPHGATQANGMYNRLITDLQEVNPSLRILGTTATPFRLSGGLIIQGDHFLQREVYSAEISRLWADGYLCRVSHKSCVASVDTSSLHKRAGEFVDTEQEELFAAQQVIDKTTDEVLARTEDRGSVLLFCCTVRHAELVEQSFTQRGIECSLVHGGLSVHERQAAIELFTSGQSRFLVNVGILTEGFDHPAIDCVVMLRATASPGLYSQCVGRGLRLHPSKTNCLLLDFGQNIERHGTIDDIRAPSKGRNRKQVDQHTKLCVHCREVVPVGTTICPECGKDLPRAARQVLNYDRYTTPIRKHAVASGRLKRHTTQRGEQCLRVEYRDYSDRTIASDYILLLNPRGRAMASQKWAELTAAPMPWDIGQAIKTLQEAGHPDFIETAKNKGGFTEVVRRIRSEQST